MPGVIVTTREELTNIITQAIRMEVGAVMQKMPGKSPDSLTTAQAAKYLKQSPNTLKQWRNQGRGPAYEKRGRSIFYKAEDLDTWRDANMVMTAEAVESLTFSNRATVRDPFSGARRA